MLTLCVAAPLPPTNVMILVLVYSTRPLIFSCFLQQLVDEADVDGDGQIDYEEFYNMMTGTATRHSD